MWYHIIILISLEFSLQGAVKDNMGGVGGNIFSYPLNTHNSQGSYVPHGY